MNDEDQASYISESFDVPLEKARKIMRAVEAKKARKKR